MHSYILIKLFALIFLITTAIVLYGTARGSKIMNNYGHIIIAFTGGMMLTAIFISDI